MTRSQKVVIIGAGIGGLTVAAVLAKSGIDVTVLEAHIYPGGCAGTFYHQGYRFDAGATLAGGFYEGGPMDLVASATGISRWPAKPSSPAMVVHMPDGRVVARWGDDRRWAARREAFGEDSFPFWRWQEETANAFWLLALRRPHWPPQSVSEMSGLASDLLNWWRQDVGLLSLLRRAPDMLSDVVKPISSRLTGSREDLRLFVDAQLLIAAQATSRHTNALYGASALDLPRRGVVHLEGGMGAIAQTLADAVRTNGGRVLYRKEVRRVTTSRDVPIAVETTRGEQFDADYVIANLTPWDLARLLGESAPRRLRTLPRVPHAGGGAFMVYAGIDATRIPADFPLHHQIVLREPMGEGNTSFLSISPGWDSTRAPEGRRAVTISTHTALKPWWDLYANDKSEYERRKTRYAERLLSAAEHALPGFTGSTDLVLPANPVTFQRFTRRTMGWVGGFPQTSLFSAWRPEVMPRIWMVGDSIFPGQSTAAVALGGLRVADSLLQALGSDRATADDALVQLASTARS